MTVSLGLLGGLSSASVASAEPGSPLPSIALNDNRRPAGVLADGILTLSLRADVGLLRPEGPDGIALRVEAFGEQIGPLQAPAPLLRVPEGTMVVANVRNDLNVPLRVYGLCSRDGNLCAPLDVLPSSSVDTTFVVGTAGTYHYWATSSGAPLAFRGSTDTQLSGAFIVDPVGTPAGSDRILVITEWTNLDHDQLRQLAMADDPGILFFGMNPRYTFLINGASWPSTERLTYRLGETVRWRVINLSSQVHPMHLHGFYYDVDSLGDGLRDQSFGDGQRQRVVTQLMRAGTTMTMTWTPERVGNWTFHCHIALHVAPGRHLTHDTMAPTHYGEEGAEPASVEAPSTHDHATEHSSAGMAGMIIGVTIVGSDTPDRAREETTYANARKLTLTMQTGAASVGVRPAYGFVLAEGSGVPEQKLSVPGPTLVLRRGEPVVINLVNQLPEPTTVHWHGIELDSYYDGVHGWSGVGDRLAPLIQPGSTFTVRLTPPRAGTFIYHTHMHDDHQLTSGMYGALLVVEPGETFDPTLDHVIVIGKSGPALDAVTLVNGVRDPQVVWKAGARHRVRLVNITSDDVFVVSLGTADALQSWRPLTKDGAPVPSDQRAPRKASQIIAVGETYDFEYETPPGRAAFWLDVRTPAGRWQTQGRVLVK